MVGCTARPKGWTFVWSFSPLEDQATETFRGRFGGILCQTETPLGVKRRVGWAEPKTAGRDVTHAAPPAWHRLKHFLEQVLRSLIALAPYGARVLIFDCGSARF